MASKNISFENGLWGIKEKAHLDPSSKEAQEFMHQLFNSQKHLLKDHDHPAWVFSLSFLSVLHSDSDIGFFIKKQLGEKASSFLMEALFQFLLTEEPELLSKYFPEE